MPPSMQGKLTLSTLKSSLLLFRVIAGMLVWNKVLSSEHKSSRCLHVACIGYSNYWTMVSEIKIVYSKVREG